ncbi:MAG: DNA gyrase subunit A [Planctomycetota bacterium]|nr:DNA gyrase subunit A [Planctomycetota bacterium]MDA1215006.1 DNA gyrase subunit A [Planctomycetota bacterium]
MSTGDGDLSVPTPPGGNVRQLDIQDEMRNSYLTYAMSVIISRALPDVRDGLKPSQRRILVAMDDLNLGPNASRTKCSKIAGETMGNYHPHGDQAIYPTLVRMAQEWTMRDVLIDKQGNFGSLAGLPPAAMRYTEARLSSLAAEMMRDIDSNTVDYVATYDQQRTEPVVLPARFPNLLVNGSSGIAVGMATSIPPHNLSEVCDAIMLMIDEPEASLDDLVEVLPGPDFPTGGLICGRMGIRQGYFTGRSTITLRARTHFETEKNADVIVVTEIPYLETRDRIREKLEQLVRDERIKGIARIVDLTDRNIPPWQVLLHIVLKRDADKDVVLNQLFQYSPLQTTISIILLALSGNRPQLMNVREMIQAFIRHRIDVIRRRTEYQLAEARKRKHTVEGLLFAQIDIDNVIQTIRKSASRAEAKTNLQAIEVPSEMLARALGDYGFSIYQEEQGIAPVYRLSANQAEAIVSMQLGSLANLERDNLVGEHRQLLDDITGYRELLSDESRILALIREDMQELQKKYGNKRRTEITGEELSNVDMETLIAEEPMVVTLSQRGYIKRIQLGAYQAQNRGGKGIMGAKADEEDPLEHVFVSSTHAFLLFFSDRGKVYWQKVYDLPLQSRTSKGRAIVNLLSLQEGERIYNCLPVRDFDEDRFLMMCTRNGIVKKTPLTAYSRPLKGGIIAINLDDGDELIEVAIVSKNDDVLLVTASGMSIRFSQADARSMGRNTRGVRGIKLSKGDCVIGMVVAHEEMSLLSVCENGYGKRTLFGTIDPALDEGVEAPAADETPIESDTEEIESDAQTDAEIDDEAEEADADTVRGNMYYRRQRRGGKGIRDIRTSARNGKVVDCVGVHEGDDILMVTAAGKIQRIRAKEVSLVGRNTQGVRVIRLDDEDTLVSIARIPAEIVEPE